MPPVLAPNPFEAVATGYGSRSVRRARILATTRRILGSCDEERFTLKRVADECEVTLPTLYNNFGSRHELMASAINEHTCLVDRAANETAAGPTMFLQVGKIYYDCALDTEQFLRNMVLSAFSPKWPLMALLQRHSTTLKGDYFRTMARDGLIRDGVDPQALGAQITRVNTISIYDWAVHNDARQMYRQITDGVSLLLLGALKSHAAIEVATWLDTEKNNLSGSRAESYRHSP